MENPLLFVTLSVFLLHFNLGGVRGVSITSIQVPPAVENGSASVVLDCDYSLASHEKQGLVVQWFFRDHPLPVYQWIPGKRPQDNGPLKGRLNLEYRASEDPYHRHRALEILNPSTDLGGDYRCKVATFDNEDSQNAHMVVYVPAASFTVEKTKPTTSTVNVTCKVEGVYPLPQLELIQEDGPHGNRMVVKETTLYISSRGGRYDATLHRVLEDKQLPSDAAFECLLSLPATEYQTAQKITYQPGAPLDGGIIPQAANDINEDHSHIGMGSGGGISIPSVSAPHRSLDAIASPAGDTTIEDDSENASVWQSGTGRGIRAHETTTDNGANVHKRPQILALLLAFFVMVSL
ncbi:uncharacterized protein LOC123477456 [Daphnia magna]|nr:uncharacterized protein LOC116930924 [Daphnia magna]XP_045036745.1 uncharacterized protein LOC123477456 [Daphnia magna]